MGYATVLRNIDELKGRYDSKAEKAALGAFAEINGWEPKAGPSSNLDHLGLSASVRPAFDYDTHDQDYDLLDHGRWFTASRRYVAAVGQPYDWGDDDTKEWRTNLTGRGLVLHIPPDPLASIHYPGWTSFLVVTRPGVRVRWLSEQTGGMVWKG